MDLRLDGEGVNRLGISATPIAQQIRTLAAQKEIPEYPIVLFKNSIINLVRKLSIQKFK